MRHFHFCIILALTFCCRASDETIIKFKFNELNLKSCYFNIPKEWAQNHKTLLLKNEGIEYRLILNDSSILFITDNFIQGSPIVIQDMNRRDIVNDTTVIYGQHSGKNDFTKGNFWKEVILKDEGVAIGYVNVLPDRKLEFERVIGTFRKKKMKKN